MSLKPETIENLRAWYAGKPHLQTRIHYSIKQFDHDWMVACGLFDRHDQGHINYPKDSKISYLDRSSHYIFQAECRISFVAFFVAIELLGDNLYWTKTPFVFSNSNKVIH